MYAGHSSAHASNELYRSNLARGIYIFPPDASLRITAEM